MASILKLWCSANLTPSKSPQKLTRHRPSSVSEVSKMAAAVAQPSVSDYLSKKQKEGPKDVVSDWAEIEELYNKR